MLGEIPFVLKVIYQHFARLRMGEVSVARRSQPWPAGCLQVSPRGSSPTDFYHHYSHHQHFFPGRQGIQEGCQGQSFSEVLPYQLGQHHHHQQQHQHQQQQQQQHATIFLCCCTIAQESSCCTIAGQESKKTKQLERLTFAAAHFQPIYLESRFLIDLSFQD